MARWSPCHLVPGGELVGDWAAAPGNTSALFTLPVPVQDGSHRPFFSDGVARALLRELVLDDTRSRVCTCATPLLKGLATGPLSPMEHNASIEACGLTFVSLSEV